MRSEIKAAQLSVHIAPYIQRNYTAKTRINTHTTQRYSLYDEEFVNYVMKEYTLTNVAIDLHSLCGKRSMENDYKKCVKFTGRRQNKTKYTYTSNNGKQQRRTTVKNAKGATVAAATD
jgi:hypothetical protein